MDRTGGETEMTSGDGRVTSRMHIHAGRSGGELPPEAPPGPFEELRARAGRFASIAGERLGQTGLGGSLRESQRGDLLKAIRENPLAAIGVAFSSGFLLAAATGTRPTHWALDQARRQLRTIVISAVTATLTHELRSLMEEEEQEEEIHQAYLAGRYDAEVEEQDDDGFDRETFGDA